MGRVQISPDLAVQTPQAPSGDAHSPAALVRLTLNLSRFRW